METPGAEEHPLLATSAETIQGAKMRSSRRLLGRFLGGLALKPHFQKFLFVPAQGRARRPPGKDDAPLGK